MRIRKVTASGMSSPLEPPIERQLHGGKRRFLKRNAAIVTVETADGSVGYAPAWANYSAMREYFQDATADNFIQFINLVVAPTIESEEIDEISEVQRLISEINVPQFLLAQAIGAVDIALHDIRGKQVGAPIRELIGDGTGSDRSIPLLASSGMYVPPREYAQQARSFLDSGFDAYKFRLGFGPETDRWIIEQVYDIVGGEMRLMADAHMWWKMGERSYSFEEVSDLLSEVEHLDLFWVEEPVPPEDHAGYRKLAQQTSVPIAGGESKESLHELIDLAESGEIQYLQGDVLHHEGYTGCTEVMDLCTDTEVTFVPQNFGTRLGLVANAHLVSVAPEIDYLEYPIYGPTSEGGVYPFPLAEEILETNLTIEDGELLLPNEPGLGVDVDLSIADEYPYVDGPWTEFIFEGQ